MLTIRSSVCPHDCPSTCALEVEVHDNARIGTLRGAEANSYTAGVICTKVSKYAERIHHPDRLTPPLLRTGPKGSGQFRRISWDEALDRAAEAFLATMRAHGAESVWPYYYAGTMGLVHRDGINRLRHELKYSRQVNTICTRTSESGWLAGVGKIAGPDPREMAVADLIVMWGGNPVNTQVNVMTHVARARKERGAKLVVIDPYLTGTAKVADLHLAIRPGTDAALACAVMHIAFRDGHADRAYMAQYADDPAALEAHLATRTPAWAAAITGLPATEIEAFAALYNTTPRAYIRTGYGFTRSRNGAASLHAVTCLPTVTGKWRHEGGGAFWNNRAIYHWDKTLIEGLDLVDPSIRALDMSRIGAVLTGDRRDLGEGPQVNALLIQNTNPVTVAPDSNKVRRGFLREDLFTVVHEQFMTETAKLADLVLPATMFMEHNDLYQAGGHSHIQIGAKLIAPGECRSNHELLQGLAPRLGATNRAYAMTDMEIIDETLRVSGWPSAATVMETRWHDAQPDFATAHFLNGFGHPDGKFHFRADWAAIGPNHAGMSALPDQVEIIDTATEDRPFRLVAAPARSFLNTTFTEMPYSRAREGRPTLLLNPEDAARLGIADGAPVRIGNARGEIVLHARLAEGAQQGVVVAESIWPHADHQGGLGINALTSDEPALPAGGAVFHDTSVWLRAEAATLAQAAGMTRAILITGAATGVGAATARRLAAPGVALLLHTRKNAEALAAVAAEARAKGAETAEALGDLSHPATAPALVEAAIARFARLDVVVANAGFADRTPAADLTDDILARSTDAMQAGFLRLARAAAPHLRQGEHPRIVAVSSFVAHAYRPGFPLFPASAAAKAGLEALVKALAIEFAPAMTVNAVAPGFVRKDAGAHVAFTSAGMEERTKWIPMGRIAETADIAAAIAFLASADASYITGQVLHVDGGLVM